MDNEQKEKWALAVETMTDSQLIDLAAAAGNSLGFYSSTRVNDRQVDTDGFSLQTTSEATLRSISAIQRECWRIFNENPHINSHVRDFMGAMAGAGFCIESEKEELQDLIELVRDDVRNELTKNIPKWAARAEIEGELFLALTMHNDGFIEIDFLEPTGISAAGPDGTGVYTHPRKQTMPILYSFEIKTPTGSQTKLIPSIYGAYYPEFIRDTVKAYALNSANLHKAENQRQFASTGGYSTFVVSWNRGFMTKRNTSHIKTTLEWVSHYSNLKKWEIDHKRSSGSYLWVVTMDDKKALRNWLTMTDEEIARTGLTAKKTPGGTLMLPPGFKVECKTPNLPTLSGQDTDVLNMVTSGLNKPEDVMTGKSSGSTFSGVKASRGPLADRIKDDLSYWEGFLRDDLWRGIIHLHSLRVKGFKSSYEVTKTVGFENKEPIERKKKVPAYKLISFVFPQSQLADIEATTRALLGVNHQGVADSLGIPRSEVAKRLGFGQYNRARYAYADEEKNLPELPLQAALLEAATSAGNASQKEQGGAALKKGPSGNNDANKDKENDK